MVVCGVSTNDAPSRNGVRICSNRECTSMSGSKYSATSCLRWNRYWNMNGLSPSVGSRGTTKSNAAATITGRRRRRAMNSQIVAQSGSTHVQ